MGCNVVTRAWCIGLLVLVAGCWPLKSGTDERDAGMGSDLGVVDVPVTADVSDAISIDRHEASGDVAMDTMGDVVDDVADAPLEACAGAMCGGGCVDTRTDPRHCGTCERDCSTLPNVVGTAVLCESGACVIPEGACDVGHGDCDRSATNGCEANLSRAETCGTCATMCRAPTPLCRTSGGAPTCTNDCEAATTRCGTSCVNTANDPSHCGACDVACPPPTHGVAVCVARSCRALCDGGYHLCGGVCADDNAVTSCGTRCDACPDRAHAAASCDGGVCGFICSTGFADCDRDGMNGCETDVNSTVSACGRCGAPCTVSNGVPGCRAGACVVAMCNAGFADCDGEVANGCEADLSRSMTCGSCTTSCAEPMPTCASTGGPRSCVSGCVAGQTRCAGSCADLANSPAHCGMCGHACAAGEVCAAGVCAGTRTMVALRTGRLQNDQTGTWSQTRLAPNAAYADDGSRNVGSFGYFDGSRAQAYSNARLGLVFPPISLPVGGRVTAARIEMLPLVVADSPAQIFRVVTFHPFNATRFVAADYGIDRWGSATLGEEPNARFVAMMRHAIDLNVTGIGTLSRTSPNILGLRTQYDLADIVPVNATPGATLVIAPGPGMSENATLVVNYDTACTACPVRANAWPTCERGTCGYFCEGGWADCDGSPANGCEVDVRVTPEHCGGCGMACGGSGTAAATGCTDGMCSCGPGRADCNGSRSDGCEMDITTDAHCGACSTRCIPGSTTHGTTCIMEGAAYVCVGCGGGGGSAQQRCCASGTPCASGLTCGSSVRGPGICP